VALALAGCASPTTRATRAAGRGEDLGLPPVSAALEFPGESLEVTLGWLVDQLARLSGQELVLAPEVRRELDGATEELEQARPVPAEEVYAFVEAHLARQGFLLAPVTAGVRPVLGVYGGPERDGSPLAVELELADLAELARHPALLCRVVLVFENLDSRQLQTQLRQLLVDSGPYQQVVPAGERALLIQAGGARMRGLVELLLRVDRACAALPTPPGPSKPQP
jgi:hypothetical protein